MSNQARRMVWDVESVGLHGEGFAVGWVVLLGAEEVSAHWIACPPDEAKGSKKDSDLWRRMWHFFNFNRDEFASHYHKRSNSETAFAMIKAKFGSSVRAKTFTAQVNEVYLKVLCHNLCCLVSAIYELGLEPTFWGAKA